MLNNNLEYIISQDDTHPNEKGHKLLAQSFWQQIGKIYG
jgi:lysophospholipase L1-like esterase